MAEQLFYEDVGVGTEITPLAKYPTPRQLVMWAGASEDFFEIHYDKDEAQARNMPGIIVHGRLKAAFLGELMTRWIGDEGVVRKLTCSYRGMDYPKEDLICKGKVAQKYIDGDDHIIECEIWTENPKGEKTTPGTATVVLPSRG